MYTITTLYIFKKEVVKIVRQKKATLFHCYIKEDIFKISIAKKLQQFDFSNQQGQLILYSATRQIAERA